MTDTIRMMALSGLAYEDEAPLGWKFVEALPEGLELQRLNNENAQLLHADSSLGEQRRVDPKDENQPLYQELHRLEYKMDVVLRLLGGLLAQRHSTPVRRKFRIYSQGLEWTTPEDPQLKIGSLGLVSLYVNQALPFPIELPVEVVVVFPATDGSTAVRAEFRGLTSNVSELLEKLIFRHHRRQVAEARLAERK